MFAGNYAPAGWALCEGQILSISDNDTLYQLIGTTYGGDGITTFALPDLRGRVPVHQGSGFTLADTGGAEEITLTVLQMPALAHVLLGADVNGTSSLAENNLLAKSTTNVPYSPFATDTPLRANAVASVGGSQPHTNFQPYLCINFIISLFGPFPSQT